MKLSQKVRHHVFSETQCIFVCTCIVESTIFFFCHISHACIMLLNTAVATNIKWATNSFRWQDFTDMSSTFPRLLINFLPCFPTAIKPPHISRQVVSSKIKAVTCTTSLVTQERLLPAHQISWHRCVSYLYNKSGDTGASVTCIMSLVTQVHLLPVQQVWWHWCVSYLYNESGDTGASVTCTTSLVIQVHLLPV